MHALTVRQPFASLILSGAKPIENRSRPFSVRGRLLIHAGVSYAEVRRIDRDALSPDRRAWLGSLPYGCIIGSVEVYDCVPVVELPEGLRGNEHAEGPWCLLLRDPLPWASRYKPSGVSGCGNPRPKSCGRSSGR
jgi:hypothetical protein